MAEGNTDSSSNWWGSWITSAKSKSSSVLEAVRKDLDELSTAVRTEVSNAGSAIGGTFKLDDPVVSNVKRSLSSFLGQVTEALIPSLEEDDADAILITSDGQITLTGFQKHLSELQMASETYLCVPDASLTENYQRWMEVTEQDQFTQNRLAKHLASSEILNEKYLTLVPDQVPHMEFWQRYLFKRALLEDALANAELAERKAKAEVNSTSPVSPMKGTNKAIIQTEQPKKVLSDNDLQLDAENSTTEDSTPISEKTRARGNDDDVTWDAEDFGTVEISEEEQARLLQEYEAEIQERELKKSLIIPLEEKLKQDKLNREQLKLSKSANKQNSTKKQDTSNNKTIISPGSNTSKAQQDKNKNSRITKQNATIENKSKLSNVQGKTTTPPPSCKDDKDEVNSDESWEKDFDLADSK